MKWAGRYFWEKRAGGSEPWHFSGLSFCTPFWPELCDVLRSRLLIGLLCCLSEHICLVLYAWHPLGFQMMWFGHFSYSYRPLLICSASAESRLRSKAAYYLNIYICIYAYAKNRFERNNSKRCPHCPGTSVNCCVDLLIARCLAAQMLLKHAHPKATEREGKQKWKNRKIQKESMNNSARQSLDVFSGSAFIKNILLDARQSTRPLMLLLVF